MIKNAYSDKKSHTSTLKRPMKIKHTQGAISNR